VLRALQTQGGVSMANAVLDFEPVQRTGRRGLSDEPIPQRAPDQVRVLVADDDPLARHSVCHYLERFGYQTVEAADGRQAMQRMSDDIAIALLDLDMPKISGLKCLQFLREKFPETQAIVISGAGQIHDAVAAMKQGAIEYITKPFDPEQLLVHVVQAARNARVLWENRSLRAALGQSIPASEFSARSVASRRLVNQVARIAERDSTVLITGESGTGKTTIARMIHRHGPRSEHPFVAVNCASLPRDLIESELFGHAKGAFTGAVGERPGRAEIADGGTLFLDEIGDLPLELQPKLLTFLQDRTLQRVGSNEVKSVDVRVIAATHQDLADMCSQKRFRQDLFYRLNVLNLDVPPLRARREDMVDLADRVLQRIAGHHGNSRLQLDAAALERLQLHSWPGNIREFENVLERASAFCEGHLIRSEDLQMSDPHVGGQRPRATSNLSLAGRTLAEIEAIAILETLAACDGNKARSARELGISEKSIYNKMRRHGISAGEMGW